MKKTGLPALGCAGFGNDHPGHRRRAIFERFGPGADFGAFVRIFAPFGPTQTDVSGHFVSFECVSRMGLFQFCHMPGRYGAWLPFQPFYRRISLRLHRWQAFAPPLAQILEGCGKIFQKNIPLFEKNICIWKKIEYNKIEEDCSQRRTPTWASGKNSANSGWSENAAPV